MSAELDDALYDLARSLGGDYAEGHMSDMETVREAMRRLDELSGISKVIDDVEGR